MVRGVANSRPTFLFGTLADGGKRSLVELRAFVVADNDVF
jgi:hypothetical protein